MKKGSGNDRSSATQGPSVALCLGLVVLASIAAWLAGERMVGSAPDAGPDPSGEGTANRRPATGSVEPRESGTSKAEELTGILEIPSETERMIALLAWLDRLPAKEYQAILENWSNAPLSMGRGREKMLILDAWTQLDPEAAATWVTKSGGYGLYQVARIWALRDPQAASDWIDRHAPEEMRDPGKSGVMVGIAESSPDLGRSHWAGWGEEDRECFMNAVEGPLMARGLDFAIGWIGSFPDQESRDRLAKGLAAGFAEVDPVKAAAWASSVEGPAARATAWEDIAEVWVGKDSARARVWAATLPPGKERGGAVAAVVSELSSRDVEAARTWLEALGGGDGLDAARGDIASSLAQEDPQAALDYSNQVEDKEERSSLQESVAEEWWKKDPSAARAWLSSHPGDVDPEWAQKMLDRPEAPSADGG